MLSITIVSLNIRSERAGVLEVALRALWKVNVRIVILQETKLIEGIHTWHI